jgi:hypothetical protein
LGEHLNRLTTKQKGAAVVAATPKEKFANLIDAVFSGARN